MHPKEAKSRLAKEIVTLYHGTDAAEKADSAGKLASDSADPIISKVRFFPITSTSMGIEWTTDEESMSIVYYSVENNFEFNGSETMKVSSDSYVTEHSLEFQREENRDYYFKVRSVDRDGNVEDTEQQHTYRFAR